MPALVAMRFNSGLKAKYDHLRHAGKPAKVAIVAVMRKLVETANALVKADRLWVPKNCLIKTDTQCKRVLGNGQLIRIFACSACAGVSG